MKNKLIVIGILVQIILVNAQETIYYFKDTNLDELASKQLVHVDTTFESAKSASSTLMGVEYKLNYDSRKNSPIFQNNTYSKGKLLFNRTVFNDIPIIYDTYLDELIIRSPWHFRDGKSISLILEKEYVDHFILYTGNKKYFFRMLNFSINGNRLRHDGYYQILYDKNSFYLKKHKSILAGADGYLSTEDSFIKVQGTYHKLSGKLCTEEIFGTHYKKVRLFMKENNIRNRNTNDHRIIDILKYYDELQMRN